MGAQSRFVLIMKIPLNGLLKCLLKVFKRLFKRRFKADDIEGLISLCEPYKAHDASEEVRGCRPITRPFNVVIRAPCKALEGPYKPLKRPSKAF